MNNTELRNESNFTFIDISSEKWRVYHFFKDSEVYYVKIHDPQWLAISPSGHRILDVRGRSHFIPDRWSHLEWEAKEDKAHFVL